jgi:DNA (cytosine-5)-methyltransferase 1
MEARESVRIFKKDPSPPYFADKNRGSEVNGTSNSSKMRRACRSKGLATAGLFSGIGGFELGLTRSGHRPILLCESDPAAREVLKVRFPEIQLLRDVRDIDALPQETQLIVAGFPCTDLSQAGAVRGLNGKQSRLVNEVLRLVEMQRVPWVLIENVPFMLWLSSGSAMRYILRRLGEAGYRCAYRTIDSRAFGLPQRRERVFILASSVADPREILFADSTEPEVLRLNGARTPIGFYWTEGNRGWGRAIDAIPPLKGGSGVGIPSPPAIWMPDGAFVVPDIKDAERLQGFPVRWTEPAERIDRASIRWRLVGNAVTTNVAEWIGSRLLRPGRYDGTSDEILRKAAPLPRAAWLEGRQLRIARVSTWPVLRRRRHLRDFLHYEPPALSATAAAGFARRARQSTLRFPRGFLNSLERHAMQMRHRELARLDG